jgi:Bacterial Ig-like domain/Peptidase family M1 domain
VAGLVSAAHHVAVTRIGPATLAALVIAVGGSLTLPARPAAAATTTQVDQRYAITATLRVSDGHLDAVEVLTITNRSSLGIDFVNLSVIPRALGYLTIDRAVTVDGAAVTTSWTTTTNLRVPLGRVVAPGATAVIRLPFELDVGRSLGAFGARLSRENGVISFGEWFPILSRQHDSYGVGDPQVSFNAQRIRLDLTTTTTLPRHAVACPGLVSAPPTTGTRWACETANVRDFSFVVNPDFRLTTRTLGVTTIRVYTETVDGHLTADRARTALTGMNQRFGTYPYADLVLAEVGALGGFSMEYPRAIHLTRSKVTDPYVISHEVAHQWFYGLLGNDQMIEPWLDEGFADFSARELMGIGVSECSARDVDSSVFAWPAGLIDGGDWTSCDGYFHTVFYQGTAFLRAVEAAMGSSDFSAAIRAFVASRRYGVTTTRQLLDHLEAWDSANLLPIYRRYLFRYDPPVVTSRLPANGDAYALPTTAVSVTFSRSVANVSGSSFALRETATGASVSATVTYDPSRRRAVLRPTSPLSWDRSYTAVLGSSIRDGFGNALSGQSWTFRTARGATFASPLPLAIAGGTHTGYRYASSGAVVSSLTATLARASGAPASMRALINGRWHFFVTAGIWAGFWLPESDRVHPQ